jgi:hypothetical protein
MSKSLLEQIQENAQFVARCPACALTPGLADRPSNQMGPGKNGVHKRGRWRGQYRTAMPVCAFCKGAKVVFLNRICECGMPAVLLDTRRKIWYCGQTNCLEAALWRLQKIYTSSSQATHGHSGATPGPEWHGM